MAAVAAPASFSIKDFFKSFMLWELAKGMVLTGRYAFRGKVTVQFPEEKTPLSPRFRGLHALRRYAGRLALDPERLDIDLTKCIFCGFCEESCPVDSIVETQILEYHGEKRGDLYFTKEMLLAVGDRYEPEIAAAKAADAKYR